MDITQFIPKRDGYDRLSAAQIQNFFKLHQTVTRGDCDSRAVDLLEGPAISIPIQGATSYTVTGSASHVSKVAQFRTHKLDVRLIELARQSYKGFIPSCIYHGMFGTTHLYAWDFVRGPAFCQVRRQLLASGSEHYLRRTVEDLARFFASAWINRPAVEPPPGLFDEYSQMLDDLSRKLPRRFHPQIDAIRSSLPLLFRREYLMAVQHDDLLENNIHVAEDTGQITGIVDWEIAMIAPFGVSICSLETLLGVQTESTWHLHHDHVSLRKHFWDTLFGVIGEVSDMDRQSMETARAFGLLRLHGVEQNAAAYLDVLVPSP